MNTEERLVVLIVEDDIEYANKCVESMRSAEFEVYHASDDVDFYRLFEEIENKLDVVVMDAVINDDTWISSRFVEMIRSKLGKGVKIIANSLDIQYNLRLMTAGSNWSSGRRKVLPDVMPRIVQSVFEMQDW